MSGYSPYLTNINVNLSFYHRVAMKTEHSLGSTGFAFPPLAVPKISLTQQDALV